MKIGYARISRFEQNIDYQKELLEKEGCEMIFEDIMSGAKEDRPGLLKAINYARSGDTLIVWKLDRLGRSLPHLIKTVKELEERGINFKSLTESLDTGTSGGMLLFHIMGSLAQFERDIIIERTKAGLASARARGKQGGRPFSLTDIAMRKLYEMYNERNEDGTHKYGIRELCKTFKISDPTLYRYVERYEKENAQK